MTRRIRRAERGQALVETAIVMPIMIFLVLGALQIMMMQHGRIMTEYAAYNAARAGIVHNGNWNVMRNAALIATLPIYQRTDDLPHFLLAWAKVKAAAEITEAVDSGFGTLERLAGDLIGIEISGITQDISVVELNVTRPDATAFGDADRFKRQQEQRARGIDDKAPLRYPDGEIDFDDVGFLKDHPEAGRLAVEVRVLYPLRIPVINKIIFELWLAQIMLNTRYVRSDLTEWAQWKARVEGGRRSGMVLDEAVAQGDDDGPMDDFFTTRQWTKEVRTLRWVAENWGLYLIPLHATYAMQMQSNMFETNRREPVWFTLD
ncbi:MAG: TadE family protein [Myxococcota bacterium]